MIKYREILRLDAQEVSKRGIAASCKCSRSTIKDVLEQAEKKGISWPLPVFHRFPAVPISSLCKVQL